MVKLWDYQIPNKLHHIRDTIGEWLANYRRNRKEAILSKIHIGHTNITHSHLLKREDSPICSMCKVPLTVKHTPLNSDSFRPTCPKRYLTSNLKDFFKNTKLVDILSFL